MRTFVTVKSGDIGWIKSDAIITAINNGGMWFGGIDRVIQQYAKEMFHDQVRTPEKLKQCDTVVATGGEGNKGKFENVIFVIDNLEGPLSKVVESGLRAAAKSGYEEVTLPTIRMGVMLGLVEKSKQEAVDQLVTGIRAFVKDPSKGSKLKKITVVVYNDKELENMVESTVEMMI